jgi:hypothetical protein
MITAARVDIDIANNATWNDAFQFGVPGDLSWSFTGASFLMDVKAQKTDVTPLLTLSSTANPASIVVTDVVNRVLNFAVPYLTIQGALPPAEYVYDLVMLVGSNPVVRTVLMKGRVRVHTGITGAT